MSFNKTSEEAKALWVEALRSGAYKQGHYRLIQIVDNQCAHCVLGVACEIYQKYERSLNLMEHSVLPHDVSSWLNIHKQGAYHSGGTIELLTRKNDLSRLSFKELADIIEKAEFVV